MSEQKSGSDLDVFEGLAKKSSPPEDAPAPFAPPAPVPSKPVLPPLARHKTLLGMPMPGSFPGSSGRPSTLPNARSVPPAPMTPMTRASIPASPGSVKGLPPPTQPTAGDAAPPGANGSAHAAPPDSASAAPHDGLPRASNVEVDMDWDEDEKTSVFEKQETTAVYDRASLTNGSGPAHPEPTPTPTPTPAWSGLSPVSDPDAERAASGFPIPPAGLRAPLPASKPPTMPTPPTGRPGPTVSSGVRSSMPAPGIPVARGSVTKVMTAPAKAVARPSKRNRNLVIGAGAVLVATGAFFLFPKSGKVAVFAAGAGGKTLSSVTVFVDGVQKCTSAPCNLDLEKGIHVVRAVADGYITQEQGATVRAGEELALNFKFDRASAGTGVKVSGKQDGVELFVDGKEIGPLPQEVKDLAPGTHTILLKGSERYVPEERTITVDADEIKDLGAVALKVARGLATFDVRTPGVRVTLVSGRDRRQLSDFSQPVEIETSKNWTVEATRLGFEDFRQPITFEDRAEKTFVINLQERGRPVLEPVAQRPEPQRQAPEPRAQEPAAPAEPQAQADEPVAPAPRAAAPSGACTLNFNSLPVSNIVLDGRPIGGTPKVGVTAPAGSHTVMFVNAEQGRKVTSVTCRQGESKTVAVRFSQP